LISIREEKGFTLIEILVAITILSFMMVSIYTVVDNNINTKEIVISEDRQFLQMYTAMHRLNEDISQMYSPLYYSSIEIKKPGADQDLNREFSDDIANNNRFIPSPLFPRANVLNQPIPIIEQETKNSLMFMTSSNKRFIEGQKQSRFSWVHYSLASDDRDEAPAENMLVRRVVSENVFERNLDVPAVRPQVLLRGVKEINFEFWSRQDVKWVDNVRLLAPEERETIRAIRLTLTFVDSNKTERTTLRIFRPFWPYFDVVKDETERQSARTATNNNNQNQNNNTGTPPPQGGN
jgi:prepilin-type N-terminal cleavage/methylation domain-containing protein